MDLIVLPVHAHALESRRYSLYAVAITFLLEHLLS